MTAKDVYAFTARKLNWLIGMGNPGPQKAQLAELRRGVGKEPGDIPQLWGVFLDGMDDEMMGNASSASSAEWAVYMALTLFAVHQQGHDLQTEPMHTSSDRSLGEAAGKLVTSDDEEERILRRFNQIATATERTELSHHLRGLVQLLRQEGIPMDYARLARDLFLYQSLNYQTQIRLRWGEDFYRTIYHDQREGENNE